MEIPVKVDGQRMHIPTNRKSYAKGSKKFVKFKFDLSSDWNGMTVTAQFVQNGRAHPRDLVGNCAYLPTELGIGKCILVLRGVASGDVIGTTNGLSLYIDDNMLVQNVDNTEIDETLYDNLIRKINGKLDKSAIEIADECDVQQVHRKPDGSLVTRVASVSGAKIGDVMQIAAVDSRGVPTALKPVSPEGLEEKWEVIKEVTIEETVNSFEQMLPPLKGIQVLMKTLPQPGYSGENYGPIYCYYSTGNLLIPHFCHNAISAKNYCYIAYGRLVKNGGMWTDTPTYYSQTDVDYPENPMGMSAFPGQDYKSRLVQDGRTVGYIDLRCYADAYLPKGTVITVLGVRA